MKNKRLLVFGLVMILMAMVASTAFAYYLNGVTWSVDETGDNRATMYLYNNNDYPVSYRTSIGQSGILSAYSEHTLNCFKDTTLSSVRRSY